MTIYYGTYSSNLNKKRHKLKKISYIDTTRDTLSPLRSRGTSSFSILQVKGGKLLIFPYLNIVLSLLLSDSGYLLIRDLGDLLTR
jgi:hypothetical protein